MNALPILLIGIPAAVAKYAEYRWNRQKVEEQVAPVERVENWSWPERWDRASRTEVR
jgi:hypothetical protein